METQTTEPLSPRGRGVGERGKRKGTSPIEVALRRSTVVFLCFIASDVFAQSPSPAPTSVIAPQQVRIVANGIPTPLTNLPGDAMRGRAIVLNRQIGMCLLCHQAPDSSREEPTPGNISTDLAGAGTRWREPELRLRMVDARRVNSASVMPRYYVVMHDDALQVSQAHRGKTILNAQQIEDVIAYLVSLK
jgi:L-cysteine S-thiosulfotransferase